MAAYVDPELNRQIDAGNPGPFDVAIDFSEPSAGDELIALGLPVQGQQVHGQLTAQQIRTLAQSPYALSIRLVLEVYAPSSEPPLSPKFGLRLACALRDPSQEVFSVVVTFQDLPDPPPEISGLSVQGIVGHGRLDRDAIQRLEAMDSVIAIETMPKFAAVLPKAPPAS